MERHKFVLEPDWSTDPDAVCTHKTGFPLIHTVSRNIAALTTHTFAPMGVNFLSDWDEFAHEVIGRSDVHRLAKYWNVWLATPLVALLWEISMSARTESSTHTRFMTRGLRKWLQLLQTAGVDLGAYGARENAILHGSDKTRHFWSSACHRVYPRFTVRTIWDVWIHQELRGFKYGPTIDDWAVLWDEPTDKFAGQFWKLIETPSLHVPGEWYDADSDVDHP